MPLPAKKQTTVLPALGLAFFALWSLTTTAVAMAKEATVAKSGEVWLLNQTYVDRGKADLFISPDAVKIVSNDWGYSLVAGAPDWTVHCFRPEEKIEWYGPLNLFSGHMLFNPVAVAERNKSSQINLGKGRMQGMQYTRYAPSRSSLSLLYESDEIKISSGAAEFINRFYDFPDLGKVPIFCRTDRGQGRVIGDGKGMWHHIELGRDLRNGIIIELVTNSWKKVPAGNVDFAPPRDFKRISDLTQVAYSKKQKNYMNEAMDEMGFVSDRDSAVKNLPQTKPQNMRQIKPQNILKSNPGTNK